MPAPTAKQLVEVRHAIPRNALALDAVGLGLVTSNHAFPSQRFTSVLVPSLLNRPTARQLVVVGHETPFKNRSR